MDIVSDSEGLGAISGYGIFLLALLTIGLIVLVLSRPSLNRHRIGRSVILLAFVPLPLLVFWMGTTRHVELSKRTEFCVSCHVMRQYGETLQVDDSDYLPAAHYQNRRIPTDQACFTCHTSYTMYGDLQAKMRGLRHVWVNYLGQIPDELSLYEPYQNRECLHCHEGARSYEESEMHSDMLEELASDETSCLECHSFVHPTEEICSMDKWERGSHE